LTNFVGRRDDETFYGCGPPSKACHDAAGQRKQSHIHGLESFWGCANRRRSKFNRVPGDTFHLLLKNVNSASINDAANFM
jgi:hypothetical protein